MRKNIFLGVLVGAIFSLICTNVISNAGERDGVTDKEILIGGLGPMTGPASNLGPCVELAGKLAVKQINAAGGIHGRKIKYLMGDTVCGSSQGLAVVKKMIFNDKVFAFHGVACTHVGMAIRPMLEKEGVPLIIPIAQGHRILQPNSPVIFRTIPPTNITGTLMGKFMREFFPKKYTKIAVIHTQEEYGASGKDALLIQLKRYGIEPMAIETHKIGDTDYSAQLLKIKTHNPEVLLLFSYSKDMGLILKQAHELGLDCVKILYIGGDYPIVSALAGKEALKEAYGPTYLLDSVRGGKLKSFVEMYEKEYPDYMKNPNNPSINDVGSYVAFQVIIEALKRAGKDLTRAKYVEALESLKDFRMPWVPPISFSPTQHEGLLQERFYRYVDGKDVIIDMDLKMD